MHLQENSIREKTEQYQIVFDSCPVGILIVSLEGSILESNRKFQEMIGYTEEELHQLNYREILPEKYQGKIEQIACIIVKKRTWLV